MRQVALVTGSARGIGLAVANALARSGFAIALNDVANGDILQAALKQVGAHHVPVMAAPFDVCDLKNHDAALQQIEDTLGPLTTLVNNAGVGVLQRGDLLEVSEASWDRCMQINAKAVFFLSQAFARCLLARKREERLFHALINITSSNAVAVGVQRAEYCASKAAAAMISKTFSVRLGVENIAVYDVQPGLIDTDLTAPVIDSYRQRARDGLTLFPRIGQVEDIGNIVATLASGQLAYTTGQVISADAGMLVPRF